MFSCEFCEISKNTFYTEHLWTTASEHFYAGIIKDVKNEHTYTQALHFFKQLGSVLSPQSCVYFQSFRSSKLFNGCLVVWPSNLCLHGIQ